MKTKSRFLICPKYCSRYPSNTPRPHILAEDKALAIQLAKAFYPIYNTIPEDEIKAIALFNPDRHFVNLVAEKYGIVFYISEKADGSRVEHYCLVNQQMESITCHSKYEHAIKAYKKLNAVTYEYSPDLLTEPIRYTPAFIGDKAFIIDNYTGEKKFIAEERKEIPTRRNSNPFPVLLDTRIKTICSSLNQ